VWPVIVAVVLVGVLFAGVYPTQTYFRQRDELDDKEAQLDDAQATNAELEGRVGELTDADNVELMAREEFGLVEPGEEVYAVVPSERTPVELPETWPLTQLSVRLERLVE
jgi:cell division protein FtsB